jgi:hypothetical protein
MRSLHTIRNVARAFPGAVLSASFFSWGYVTEQPKSVAAVFYVLSFLGLCLAIALLDEVE